MADMLADVAAASRARAETTRAREPLARLRARALACPQPPGLTLAGFDLIAEVKLRSPAAGRLAERSGDPLRAVRTQALAYERAGAAAISVLTEPTRFDGELEHLVAAIRAVRTPVMRKDFLVDPCQVYEARAAGASGVLLILRMLDDGALRTMLEAAGECGLFVLLEAFDRDELQRGAGAAGAYRAGPALVGVNTRDLASLAVDRARLKELAPALPAGVPAVAESGVETPRDAADCAALGYRLALVGGALMRSADPETLARDMIAEGRRAAPAGGRPCASA